ncbi:TPA: Lrp/AsnC family transcriptional regulator [Candidatus Woesearchaeota archaeon]|nr:Lrp/AsnC family transcriptional regulator [Candidatus Woesearchaeota archaeon]HIH91914.1 Lrp/AsnC family transcriptional regulator [Candidatus Woesearchaeota archaeon]HII64428.1 Lrp/AsnC family transcriptional regulator [Candidatus Woesearchaeota archaeon]HII65214.1 Lrp/AsnC family transcriptional regulator [Candidatus Woesearchaeota archaeon]HIJ18807.1 Lrp/AsnC family transcriptional regulator [Candidatus Woesearchaeota archaeon]
MKPLDEKDRIILNVLRKEAKLSTKELSRKTKIPITTIHNRMKRMEGSGIIKGYTVVLDNQLTGNVISFVLISVMYRLPGGEVINQEELAKKVATHEMVEEVSIITGSMDLIAKVRANTVEDLNNFVIHYLRTIAGIERTQTLVVLKSL